jgi:hypothetical protein
VRSEIDAIRAQMGVCPQFDILWNELTSGEQIALFGALKGMKPEDVCTPPFCLMLLNCLFASSKLYEIEQASHNMLSHAHSWSGSVQMHVFVLFHMDWTTIILFSSNF